MLDGLVPAAAIVALVAVNGLFVAAEFALIGAPRAAVEKHAAEGRRIAVLLRGILNDPRRLDHYIATAQLGITLASLGLGMYGERVMARGIAGAFAAWGAASETLAHSVASVVAVTLLTYLHIVLGEMVPKSLALHDAEGAATRVLPFVRATKAVLNPLVLGLNGLGNMVLGWLRIERRGASEACHTPEELQAVIQESQEGGLLGHEASQVLKELLDFGELTAGEVMVPRTRVVGVPLGAKPSDLAATMKASPHTRYPVHTGDMDHIVGMALVKDLLRIVMAGRPVATADVKPVPFVPETAELEAVLRVMREQGAQMVVVMDEHGGTAGILTIEDLFEEVVGAIGEGVDEVPELALDVPGRWRVAGTLRLDRLAEVLGRDVSDEAVDTVSGLVLDLLGRPPLPGDVVERAGVRFVVTAVEGHGVKACTVTVAEPPPVPAEDAPAP